MKPYAIVWKQIGETPLEALARYRAEAKLAVDIPLAYAGRLDPMAEGKLIILIGDECKKLTNYTGLDKQYSFEILFGYSSDTGDVLGLTTESKIINMPTMDEVRHATKKFIGTHLFPYPAFSSKTVQGKQLHKWALEGKLDEIEMPTKKITIYNVQATKLHTITKQELQQTITKKIETLTPVTDPEKAWGSDFRKAPILARWHELLQQNTTEECMIVTCRATVSSGTYIRTLAEKIAEALGTHGLAYAIRRDTIGSYIPIGHFGFWRKRF